MTTAPKTPGKPVPTVSDAAHAPFIFVEEAPSFGNTGATVNVTLAAYRHIPNGTGSITSDLIVTAHLRCTIAGAMTLRKALDDALLLGAPTGSPN